MAPVTLTIATHTICVYKAEITIEIQRIVYNLRCELIIGK